MLKFSIILLGLLAFAAQAHFPLLNCQLDAKQQLACIAGYSDGSLSGKVTLTVYSYDEKKTIQRNHSF